MPWIVTTHVIALFGMVSPVLPRARRGLVYRGFSRRGATTPRGCKSTACPSANDAQPSLVRWNQEPIGLARHEELDAMLAQDRVLLCIDAQRPLVPFADRR